MEAKCVRSIRRAAGAWAIAVLCAAPALAVAPVLGNIQPRGAQRGAEVEVSFVGSALADAAGIVFHDAGIAAGSLTAESDTTVKVKLAIAPDCRLGTHAMRVRTKSGISNLMLFSVGALPEIAETEPNNDPAAVPDLAFNQTVNGTIESEDVDYFALPLDPGQRIAVEVEAIRLAKILFDPKLRLFGPHGHELVAEDDTQMLRQDAGIVFTAAEAGRHVLAVSDASYGGNGDCQYRLHVGHFPRPLGVTPMGGAPGAPVQLTWLGDPGLAAQQVTVPALPLGTGAIAAQSEGGISPTEIPFRVSELAGTLEAEPNDARETATAGAAPGAFDGVIAAENDLDFFSFEGKKDQVFDLRVWARALGSPLDPLIVIQKPDGSLLAADDDSAAVDAATRVTLPEDGVYRFYVHDHLKRGGAAFAYRVEVTPVVAKLRLSLLENRPVSVTVPAGNQSYLLVNTTRADWDGPVKFSIPDLPPGVTAQSEVLPAGVTTWPVILTAAADAPAGGGLVNLDAVWDDPNQQVKGGIQQEVVLVYGPINETTMVAREVDRLALAVAEPAPFSVAIVQPQTPAVQTSARNLTVNATRAEGFTAPIDLYFPYLPPGLGGGTAQIPEGQNSVQIRVEVRGDAAPGLRQVFVGARGAGYQLCSQPIPFEIQEPWVRFELAAVETEIGKAANLTVKLAHRTPFEGSFDLALFGLPRGVTAPAVQYNKDSAEVVFPLTVAADAPEGKFEGIGVSTAIVAGNESIEHVAYGGRLALYAPLPPELQAAAPPPAPEAAPGEPERKTRFPAT